MKRSGWGMPMRDEWCIDAGVLLGSLCSTEAKGACLVPRRESQDCDLLACRARSHLVPTCNPQLHHAYMHDWVGIAGCPCLHGYHDGAVLLQLPCNAGMGAVNGRQKLCS